MKQIVEQLNKIAKKIDENVDIPNTDLITDSLDAITTALGGTPNDSNLIVDKLEDIAGVATGGGGESPIRYCKVNIVNNSTYDIWLRNPEAQLAIDLIFYSRLYYPEDNSCGEPYEQEPESLFVEKNGGTRTFYFINQRVWINRSDIYAYFLTWVQYYAQLDITYTSNVEHFEFNGEIGLRLIDNTKNGEITVTLPISFEP